ncbi:hypothetical protein HK405_006638 [Cladochytrium tenue]|nr:hypothetical protein HK405_006638 [Cladochytrium tenue]
MVKDFGTCYRFCYTSLDRAVQRSWPDECTVKNSRHLRLTVFTPRATDRVIDFQNKLFRDITKPGDCAWVRKHISASSS